MRPEGWPELGAHPCSGDGCLECRDYANREAGADAMYEGLKKMGTHTNVVEDGLDIEGWRVFIEEKR